MIAIVSHAATRRATLATASPGRRTDVDNDGRPGGRGERTAAAWDAALNSGAGSVVRVGLSMMDQATREPSSSLAVFFCSGVSPTKSAWSATLASFST